MNKSYLVGLVSLGMLIGCGDDAVVNENSEAKKTGSVSVFVEDIASGAALDSATVEMQGAKLVARSTNVAGMAQWTGLTIGEYVFVISKTGYATRRVVVNLDDNAANEAFPRVQDQVSEVMLPRMGAAISGKAFYTEQGQTKALSGATVVLNMPNGLLPSQLTATTGTDGAYSFASLPEMTEYSVAVLQTTVAGKVYALAASESVDEVHAGETRIVNNMILNPNSASLLLTETNAKTIGAAEALTMVFSDGIDVAELKLGDLTMTAGGEQVLITWTLSADKRTMTISPFAGKWFAGVHTVTYSVTSEKGASKSGTLIFSPGSATGAPANSAKVIVLNSILDTNKVDEFEDTYQLIWNKVASASGYYIYAKSTADSAYVMVDHTQSTGDTTETVYGPTISTTNTVTFLVQPYNDNGAADISTGAATVTPAILVPAP